MFAPRRTESAVMWLRKASGALIAAIGSLEPPVPRNTTRDRSVG